MTKPETPAVEDTDLTREELEEVAAEYGIDASDLDDQQLLQQVGVALGEVDESSGSEAGSRADDVGRDGGGSADDAEGDGDADDGSGEQRDDEQSLPGETVEGPTRDELRAELRSLGLPVSGTKDELQQRLDEAKGDDGGAAAKGDAGGADTDDGQSEDQRLRDRIADLLDSLADRIRESGDDDDEAGEDEPGKLRKAGRAVKDRATAVGAAGGSTLRKAGRAVKDKVTSSGGSDGPSKLGLVARGVKNKVTPG